MTRGLSRLPLIAVTLMVAVLPTLVRVPSASALLMPDDVPFAHRRELAPRHAGHWPLSPQPQVVARFDPPAENWGTGHRGVDLAGHIGQPVLAALDGTVTFVGRIAGRGIVVVEHGRRRTTYQPVRATVPRGALVSAGQPVGRLELFGSHCLPRACLHWGLIGGSTYLDPLALVGGAPRPVRLLPLSPALA